MGTFDERPIPKNLDAERALLGGVLVDNGNYPRISNRLHPNDFSVREHQVIYRRIGAMVEGGLAVELLTLVEELTVKGELDAAGGVAFVSSLLDGIHSKLNVDSYASIILEKSKLRQLATFGNDLVDQALSPTAEAIKLVEELEVKVEDFSTHFDGTTNAYRTWTDIPGLGEIPTESAQWVVNGMIPAGAVVLLAAEPGIGKTWLAMGLSKAVSHGRQFLGRDCRPGKVLYLDRENSPAVWNERRTLLKIQSSEERLKVLGGWNKEGPPAIGDSRLCRIAKAHAPFIVFDSFIRFHSCDENSAKEMSQVMNDLRSLANRGATVLVLHHTGKSDASRFRGSSDILAGVDLAYTLQQEDEGTHRLSCFKNRLGREFTIQIKMVLDDTSDFVLLGQGTPRERKQQKLSGLIYDFLVKNPNSSVKEIAKGIEVPEKKVRGCLKEGKDRDWRIASTRDRGEHLYQAIPPFIIEEEPSDFSFLD